jgi:gas vesicle protein
MRFVLGLAIGFGVGFAGALLFAPDRSKGREGWPAGSADEMRPPGFEDDHNFIGSVKRTIRSVREQVDEAREEAKKAQEKTERELRERYEREVRREMVEAPNVEAEKSKGKEKKSK